MRFKDEICEKVCSWGCCALHLFMFNRIFYFLFSFGLILTSCEDVRIPFLKGKEGYIKYEVSFPNESGVMAQFYPKEMTLFFNEHTYHAVMSSSYGVVSSEFLVDHQNHRMLQYLKAFKDKKAVELQGKLIQRWLLRYPNVKLVPTQEVDTIAGFVCQKTVAYFLNDSLPYVNLYTTKDIKVKDNNWWNKYEGVEGVLMGYEINMYGKRMCLRAKEVVFENQPKEKFDMPQGYDPVDIPVMDSIIHELAHTFS